MTGGGEIIIAIAIQISCGDGEWLRSGPIVSRVAEYAIPGVQQHGDCMESRTSSERKVFVSIAIQVCRTDPPGGEAHEIVTIMQSERAISVVRINEKISHSIS